MGEVQRRHPAAGAELFMHRLGQPTYEAVASLRAQMQAFFDGGPDGTKAGNYLLTVTEILTNLIKHPAQKASRVSVTLARAAGGFILDVADDSTPFQSFAQKCEEALARASAPQCMEESGYGLACILKQHAHVAYEPGTASADGLNHFRAGDAEKEPRRKVFLIDDDPIALKIEGRMLKTLYDVRLFPGAREALEAFGAEKPDLVISDIMMPGMDGTELRRALARLPSGGETPFIFLSGERDLQHAPYVNALGIDDFLCKPATEAQLLSVSERLLRRSAQIRNAVHGKMSAEITGLLRPALPAARDGWEFEVTSLAAETGGGDFVLHRADGAGLTVLLADVMGHGHVAKFFAYAYAGYLRSLFNMSTSPDPAALLEQLSGCVSGDPFLESMIMTCQGVRLARDGTARIVSAGHPCPVLVTGDGARDIDVAGPLPGLAGESRYAAKVLQLKPGESILLATDGFFGAFDGKDFRHEGLLPLLGTLRAKSAKDMAQALWQEYLSKAQDPQMKDDATLVIMAYKGE